MDEASHVPTGKSVIAYLQEMIKICCRHHRHELEREYLQSLELVTDAVYGPLPPRPLPKPVAYVPEEKLPTPGWKRDMMAKPYRKIVARFSERDPDPRYSFVMHEYERLECGHVVSATPDLPDSPPAKRRRCSDCRREAEQAAEKKQPGREPQPLRLKASAGKAG
jgi:hypothetical protein